MSACLLGHPVRYDATARPARPVLELLRHLFRLVPVCPEVEIGLGVPREPIELVGGIGGVRVRGVNPPHRDHTAALRAAARRFLERYPDLRGMVVKSRSPSCALDDAPVAGTRGRQAPGMFVQTVLEQHAGLVVVDERGLASDRGMMAFLIAMLDPRQGPHASLSSPDEMARLLRALAASPKGVLGCGERDRLLAWLDGRP